MSASANSFVEQVSRRSGVVVTKQRLAFMVNQEIMEDALRVEDYKMMASQLENSRRLEKGKPRLLLMIEETTDEIWEKITLCWFALSFGMMRFIDIDVVVKMLVMWYLFKDVVSKKELARAAESDVTKDQLVLLFEREIAESVGKIEEYRRLCIELRANMRLRNDYISELRLYRSCDDVLGSIAMLRTMQSDDSENAARLLSLARETQRKVDEKTAFIRRIRERTPGTAL
ncbi:hypothetical protein Tco_0434652 [Tanacetum coccineum]